MKTSGSRISAVIGRAALSASLVATALAAVALPAQASPAGPKACISNVGNTGLSAAVVAHSGQTISRRLIDTTCDIGIFVGPGVSHVTVDHVSVTGANFQGILAIDTSYLTVKDSLVSGNGFNTVDPNAAPLPGNGVKSLVSQSFAISLFGVSHSKVVDNTVTDNGRGGIGLMDNGPNDPGAMLPYENPKAHLVASSYDSVVGNAVSANYSGCGLVVATQNFGGHLSHLTLADNTITGTGMSRTSGPDIGGIVVAADLPGSSVTNVVVDHNTVSNSFEGGVIVNAEATNSFTKNIRVIGNTVAWNNWGHQEAPATAGVIVFANPKPLGTGPKSPQNYSTSVIHNTLAGQYYGIYSEGQFVPKMAGNRIEVPAGGIPVYHSA